jgi:tetratricopeptide (TPR) repeat protein
VTSVRAQTLSLALFLAVTPALAQPAQPPRPPAGSRVEEGQRLLAEGLRLFARFQYGEAILAFQRAYAATPTPALWYNIGLARLRLAQYDAASQDFQRYLRDRPDAPDREEVARLIEEATRDAERQRNALQRHALEATLRVDTPALNAVITVDDRPWTARGSAAVVTPGEHRVRVTAPGHQDWLALVRARAGEASLVLAQPQPLTRYRSIPAGHGLSLAIAVTAGGALAVGGYFGLRALSAGCVGCDDQRDLALRADVLFGVGLGLALSAVVVYFVERGRGRTERVLPVGQNAPGQ